jgi:hypothetical protein
MSVDQKQDEKGLSLSNLQLLLCSDATYGQPHTTTEFPARNCIIGLLIWRRVLKDSFLMLLIGISGKKLVDLKGRCGGGGDRFPKKRIAQPLECLLTALVWTEEGICSARFLCRRI